jgi:hypothetical protein
MSIQWGNAALSIGIVVPVENTLVDKQLNFYARRNSDAKA